MVKTPKPRCPHCAKRHTLAQAAQGRCPSTGLRLVYGFSLTLGSRRPPQAQWMGVR